MKTDPNKENIGLTDRFSYSKKSGVFTLSGKIHTDICNQGRILLNGLPLKVAFHRNKDVFSLMADSTGGSTMC